MTGAVTHDVGRGRLLGAGLLVAVEVGVLAACGGATDRSGGGQLDLPRAVQTVPTGPLPREDVDGMNELLCQEFGTNTDAWQSVVVAQIITGLRFDAGLPGAGPGEPAVTEMELTSRMIDRVTTGCGANPTAKVAALVSGIAHETPEVYLS